MRGDGTVFALGDKDGVRGGRAVGFGFDCPEFCECLFECLGEFGGIWYLFWID